jgi:hypothetical protein
MYVPRKNREKALVFGVVANGLVRLWEVACPISANAS